MEGGGWGWGEGSGGGGGGIYPLAMNCLCIQVLYQSFFLNEPSLFSVTCGCYAG